MLLNDVKDAHTYIEGVYTFEGFSDEMDYWVDAEKQLAIWYKESGSTYIWIIGHLSWLGSLTSSIYSQSNVLEKKCPYNEGYLWSSWKYWYDGNSSWIPTNDVDIKCADENDFCTSENPCVIHHGDCDIHNECQDGLVCGSNNCPDYLGFHSELDCCYNPIVGDEHFCASGIPCGEDEGDCDYHDECQGNLKCGSNNCPQSLG